MIQNEKRKVVPINGIKDSNKMPRLKLEALSREKKLNRLRHIFNRPRNQAASDFYTSATELFLLELSQPGLSLVYDEMVLL